MMKKIGRIILRIVLILFVLVNVLIASQAWRLTHYYDAGNSVPSRPGIAEKIFGVKNYKRKSIAPDTAFQTVTLNTSDGIKLDAWLLKVAGAKGTVALFHGHGGNKDGVLQEAYAFNKMGYNCLLTDFRAHGNSEGNVCTIGYKESRDVKAAYDYLKENGEKHIVLWGISLGAATISKAVSDYGITPDKVILEMPFGTLHEAVEGRLRMMKLPPEPLSAMLTFWGGIENGFWAFSMKPEEYVKKINCPVLLQWGAEDPRVSKNEIDEIYKNIPSAKKLVVYEQSKHQSLCINEHDKWVTEVGTFLNGK